MLGDAEQGVLDVIAQGEAPDYNTIYGGHKFSSLRDHPRIPVPLPNGQISTAAGRYQLLAPTWDTEKKRLGLKDFSPASQDQAAWDLAQRTYEQKTGRDLAADAGQQSVNWGALCSQWPSLHRFDQQEQAAPAPGPVMPPGLGEQPAPAPSLENQPPAGIGQRFGLQLQPIDYDPFSTNQLGVPGNAPAATRP